MTKAPFHYYWSETLSQRNPGRMCPERPERLQVISPDHLRAAIPDLHHRTFVAKPASILELIHTPAYIRNVQQAGASSRRFLDNGDTAATTDIFEQALLSASAGCVAIDAIKAGETNRAFCAVRPPGHHANTMRAMGFCIFNNVAIAARYAQEFLGVKRVLILDWDNDPGNGTQEIFWEDPSVYTLSFHQSDLFPAAGGTEHYGAGAGEGFNKNAPFDPGTTEANYMMGFEKILSMVCDRFSPELLIIAAGFDAHNNDPQSKMALDESSFAKMTTLAIDITSTVTSGRTLSILEGGYNLGALQASVTAHCKAMMTPASSHPTLINHETVTH